MFIVKELELVDSRSSTSPLKKGTDYNNAKTIMSVEKGSLGHQRTRNRVWWHFWIHTPTDLGTIVR